MFTSVYSMMIFILISLFIYIKATKLRGKVLYEGREKVVN